MQILIGPTGLALVVASIFLSSAAASAALIAEKAQFDFSKAIAAHIDSPSRFAEPLFKRVDSKSRGAWSQDGDLAVWTYAIEVPGAVSMGFYADNAFLPPTATVEVQTESVKVVYGSKRFRSGTLLTSPLPGSKLTVIVRLPATSKGQTRFSIDRFNIGYKSLVGGAADHPLLAGMKAAYYAKTHPEQTRAGTTNDDDNSVCDRNFICERNSKPEITDPGQAVVGVTTFGVGFCSASLVMDASGSFTTFLATAAHCVDYGDALPPNADGYIISWSQETPCGSDLQFVGYDPSMETTGAIVRSMYQDALLLEATDAPPFGANPFWAGWNAEDLTNFKNYPAYDPANPNANTAAKFCDKSSPTYNPRRTTCDAIKEQALYGIHHGRVHTKQYVESGTTDNSGVYGNTTYTLEDTMPSYTGSDGQTKAGPDYQAWALGLNPIKVTGRIAGGSSGSGLWYASKKQIIGTLSISVNTLCERGPRQAGTSTDGDVPYYQRFRESFYGPAGATSANAHKFWLDPSDTGISQRDGSYNAARVGDSIVSLTSTRSTVKAGESITLNWTSSKAGFCHLTGPELADQGQATNNGPEATKQGVDPNGTQTFTVNNSGQHDYALTCRNDAQVMTTSNVSVQVTAVENPTLSFTADKTTVIVGDTVTLNWASANTNACNAFNAWSGTKALSGSEVLTPAAGTRTYQLLCGSDSKGSVTRNITITANPKIAPVVNLSASASRVTQGNTVLLSWNSSNTDSCAASGDWTGAMSTTSSMNVTVSNLGTNTYNLTCNGPGGTATKTVTVTGDAPVNTPPTTSPTPPSTPVTGGGGSGGGGSFGFLSLLLALPAFMRKRKV